MIDLVGITTFVNLLALAASLWLGFYIITRSSHSDLSRLAALTLWLLGAFFLYNTLAINLPGTGVLAWLRQTIILVLPVWLHVTVQLAPGKRAWTPRTLVGLALAYGVALILFIGGVVGSGWVSDASSSSAVYTSGRAPGPLFVVFFVFLAVILAVSALNLRNTRMRTTDAVLRKQCSALLLATALAGLGGLDVSFGIQFGLDWPTLPSDIALAAGVLLLGYAVARYSALLEGWRIERDFLYTLIALGSLTAFYVFVTLLFYLGGHISFLTLILVVVGTISFNSLYDGLRVALDRLFYHGRFQQLRANLRALAREAGAARSLPEQLEAIMISLCRALGIQKGLVALKSVDRFQVVAAHNTNLLSKTFPLDIFATAEIVGLRRVGEKELEEMGLLVPIFVDNSQVGALVLGHKERKHPYDEQDLELLDDLADQIAGVVRVQRLQEENTKTMNAMIADFRQRERTLELQVQQMLGSRREETRPVLEGMSEEDLVRCVEDALRHLDDYPFLAKHPLAKLHIVDRLSTNQTGDAVTSLDRGRMLHQVILLALDKLRPSGAEPKTGQIPPREWLHYTIINDSYVRNQATRDVMARLYIGEGTFNRTRKRAVRGIATAILEMEQQATSDTREPAR